MDEDKCVELLEKHGVKSTANRIMIVKALAEEENPKSVKELEDKLVLIDKSNIFRALTIFRKHHLVHTIEDGNGGIRYELCMSHSSVDDDDEHVHFFCEKCGKKFWTYIRAKQTYDDIVVSTRAVQINKKRAKHLV